MNNFEEDVKIPKEYLNVSKIKNTNIQRNKEKDKNE